MGQADSPWKSYYRDSAGMLGYADGYDSQGMVRLVLPDGSITLILPHQLFPAINEAERHLVRERFGDDAADEWIALIGRQ